MIDNNIHYVFVYAIHVGFIISVFKKLKIQTETDLGGVI